jgi:hypothetical protein
MIQEGIKTANYREITKWNEVIQGGIDAEILVVGSSRALVHFDCEYIEKVTGKTCYNLGFDGTSIPLQKLMFDLYLSKNKAPESLIWSLDFHSFTNKSDYYGFDQLVPYQENEIIQEILEIHETESYQFDLPIFRYSFNPQMKFYGLASYLIAYAKEPVITKGYRKSTRTWGVGADVAEDNEAKGENIVMDEAIVRGFYQYIASLKVQYDIRLIMTPYYITKLEKFRNLSEAKEKLTAAAEAIDVNYLDLSATDLSLDQNNFYNESHMTTQGMNHMLGKIEFENL